MRILYFTNQDIGSGLFDTQVYGNLLGLKKLNKNIKITLLVFNRPWKYFKHKPKVEEIKSKNINVIYLPLCPPMRYFTSSIFSNKLYVFYFSVIFKLLVKYKNYDLIHCRHYLPSLVCKSLGIKNILFDVRSLSLFENVQAKKIKFKSKNYQYWLKQEEELINYVDGISVVSKSMIKYFKQYLPKRISYCPIIVDSDKVYFSNKERIKLRNEWNWSKKNVYVYSGTFGLYGLNKEYLFKLISSIINSDDNAKFLFLLSNDENEFNSFIKKFDLNINNFRYYSVSPNKLYKFLSAADIGIHSLPNQLDSFTRLGTKVVEYWAAGLPTLLNNHIGEAAYISKQNNFGKVIDLTSVESNKVFNFKDYDKKYIVTKSLEIFERKVVLNNYLKLYNKIILKS